MTWLDILLTEGHEPKPYVLMGPVAADSTLEALCVSVPSADALDLRQERAAILEYDADHSREWAEQRAGLR